MPTTRPRRGAALILAAALLLAALPAAAQPAARTGGTAGKTALAPAWLQAATAWLIGLLPSSVPGASTDGWRGADADPLGDRSMDAQRGSEGVSTGEPSATPQRGPDIDPNG